MATLRRIDGWGPLAWKEVLGAWQVRGAVLAFEPREAEVDPDADRVTAWVVLPGPLAGRGADAVTVADWVLRMAWARLLDRAPVVATTIRPGAAIRATNGCFRQADGQFALRLVLDLPYAGMCIDGRRLGRFVTCVEAFAASLINDQAGLRAAVRAVLRQRALRAALASHGLCAFMAEGSVLPRAAGGGPAPGAMALRVTGGLRCTVDAGRWGRVTGLGIPCGVTAIAGAPYHGKSTLLAAIQAGIEDHPPGDGREGVVADASAVAVMAEEGRRVRAQDLSGFFAELPAVDPHAFSTDRASGATSMASSVLQAVAAGSRLLLIDEDTAASNFLTLDAGMRRLLGRRIRGTTTLLEVLPDLTRQGVSAVVVAGATASSLGYAGRVVMMDHFQPGDATRAARRIVARMAGQPVVVPSRRLVDDPDRWLGPRHFLAVDCREPERPVLRLPGGHHQALDLRRCGWPLDAALTRGAVLGAAWCWRLAEGGCDMAELRTRFAAFMAARGPAGLDPFHTDLVAEPPWQLVVSVIERLA